MIGLARTYVERLSERMPVLAAAVVGSVARGDFNVWSDVDVVVICDDLPDKVPDRGAILSEDAPGGVQAIGFTRAEFAEALRKQNPLAAMALEDGVILIGEAFFRVS